ncbi:hypothetical protein KR054_001344 [Drosophila jambulina]|nr:hypothetical protein KR054_001344 [Drosophila jambulina]
MINASAAGQQVTPAGAAIKLHFACNNNNNNSNNSNNSSSNYSGLKAMEHKMSNNNNNNNNANNRWQKIELIRRQLSSEAAAAAAAAGAAPASPQPMGFYKPTLSEESEDHLSNSVAAAAAASSEARRYAPPGSAERILWSRALLKDDVVSFPISPYTPVNALQCSLQDFKASKVAAKGKVTATATNLRWLSMPVAKTQAQGEAAAAGAARSALVNPQQQVQRTEDQENAFRRIEDVHNYAKLQDCSSDDADADDDEDDEEEEEEEQEQELGNEDEQEEDDEEEEEGIQVQLPAQQVVTRIRREDTEEHVDVDVVTVPLQEQPQLQQQQESIIRPEHHARRPMNAFLIFCKRHRAIVKERYKTLENRAITKILGDWWAALDEKEKQCFTDLAQQNKDAFFNANPNFKWYKLPAPPLRTLATRPSNAAAGVLLPNSSEEQSSSAQQQLQMQWSGGAVERSGSGVPLALLRRNYFKLADETQMGDLSSLLQVQVPEKDYALQQVLSETSQFLSAHMPPAGGTKSGSGSGAKRSLPDSNSSNSSEEEPAAVPSKKVKSSRSCKGKIYQELVNSGQLSAIAKSKNKSRGSPSSSGGNLMMLGGGGNFADISLDAAPNTPPVSPPERHNNDTSSPVHLRSVSESSSSGFFDLEEKIKDLPALSLDAYLQRKRSTKKKKKFSGSKKQRNSGAAAAGAGTGTGTSAPAAGKQQGTVSSDLVRIKHQQQQQQAAAAAVGSQRRKARKESITRRDVSAIEQEVASILPLTINGCYYFDQSDAPRALSNGNVNGNAASLSSSPSSLSSSSSSPPLSSNSSSSSSSTSLTLSLSSPAAATAYDVMTSSTSDLLILAEVAANRTELNSKSN